MYWGWGLYRQEITSNLIQNFPLDKTTQEAQNTKIFKEIFSKVHSAAVWYKAIYDDKIKVLEKSALNKNWYKSEMKALVQTSLDKYLHKSEMKGLVQTSLEKYLYKSEMKCSVQISLDKYL